MSIKKQLENFGIDTIDYGILTRVKKNSKIQPYALSKELPYPRTTINYRIEQLLSQNWLKKVPIKKRYGLTLTEQSSAFLSDQETKETLCIQMFSELEEIKDIFEHFSNTQPKERGYFIEPANQSVALYEKLGGTASKELQDAIRSSGQIYEGIVSMSTVSILESQDAQYVQSMFGRLIELYVVPDEALEI